MSCSKASFMVNYGECVIYVTHFSAIMTMRLLEKVLSNLLNTIAKSYPFERLNAFSV